MKTFVNAALFFLVFAALLFMVPPVNTFVKSQLLSASAGPASMITSNGRYFVEVSGDETLNSVCAAQSVNGVNLIAKDYPVASENIGHLFYPWPYIFDDFRKGSDYNLFAGDNSSPSLFIQNCPTCRFSSGTNASFSCKGGSAVANTTYQSAACQGIYSINVIRSCSTCARNLDNATKPKALYTSIFGECQLPPPPTPPVPPAPSAPPTPTPTPTPTPPPATNTNRPSLGFSFIKPAAYPSTPLISFNLISNDDPSNGAQSVNTSLTEASGGLSISYLFQDPSTPGAGYVANANFSLNITNLASGYKICPSTSGIAYTPQANGTSLIFQFPGAGSLNVKIDTTCPASLGPLDTPLTDIINKYNALTTKTPEGRLRTLLQYLNTVLPAL